MRVTVVRPGDLGPSEASLWARFQKSFPELQNPFFSLTFAQVVGRHRPNSRVAVVEDDGAVQAFLPFDLGPQRIGVPIGDPMNNLQGFISEGGATIDARRVIRKPACVAGGSPPFRRRRAPWQRTTTKARSSRRRSLI